MAFKEVASLDADTTISLGGVNKKTGKANPKTIEGFYLGSKQVADKKKQSGFSSIYIFQTPKGNVGVWGKTDMDKKMSSATPGAMTRVTSTGTRPTPNGDMYTYKVEIDLDNTTDVVPQQSAANDNSDEDTDDGSDSGNDGSDTNADSDEDTEDRQQAVALSALERKARVNALLNKGNKNTSKAG